MGIIILKMSYTKYMELLNLRTLLNNWVNKDSSPGRVAGFVNRGTKVPAVQPRYFFLDWRYFFLFGPWTAVLSEIWTAGPPVLFRDQYFPVLQGTFTKTPYTVYNGRVISLWRPFYYVYIATMSIVWQ